MNKKTWWLALACVAFWQAALADTAGLPAPELHPLTYQARTAHLAAEVLNRYHYPPTPLDGSLSGKVFDRYLKSLDPDHMVFLQSDLDQWAGARPHLDEAIRNESLTLPFYIFNTYTERTVERYTYARSLLKKGFDFSAKESIQLRRDKEPWPQSETEARELWRKRVKNDWLRIKLTGKNDKQIVDTLDKRYDNFLKRLAKVKSEDAFQIFMNAYTLSLDPHTNYLGPRASEDFDISMRLSLVGIGASLEDKDDYTTIRELIAGSPALLSGQLKVGDRIVGVAQGDAGTMVDVIGWRLDDTVALIRGAADSTVVLEILPGDAGPEGKHKRVSLVRKKISLEEQAAKKSVQTVSEGGVSHRVGVISLPGFYQDFAARQNGDKNFKSATRDVARLLAELKAEQVDSILIDLRNNGGGSLVEAVELTGLFIDTGPVVMQRDAQGHIDVQRDTDAGVAWNGPLGVLINRSSASASEIFAAAIQDYHRGVVIGEPSFGKGTVQTMIDLDTLGRRDRVLNSQKLGELKLTIAQFFRIDGGTTQLRGVTPDISLPGYLDPELYGESSFDNALPWTRIKPADYHVVANLDELMPTLQSRHDTRIAADKDFQYLLEDIADLKTQRDAKSLSLTEAERRRQQDAREARQKRHGGAAVDAKAKPGTEAGGENDDQEQDPGKKGGKDPLLKEAVHILSDEVDLLNARPDLASRALPSAAITVK